MSTQKHGRHFLNIPGPSPVPDRILHAIARHDRFAETTRRAVKAWGLEILCENPQEYSGGVTAAMDYFISNQ